MGVCESITAQLFRNASDTIAGAVDLAGSSASSMAEQYASAFRLQIVLGRVICLGYAFILQCSPSVA